MRATMNEVVVIHYLSYMFETLLSMQTGWEWQRQVVIRNMQGGMKKFKWEDTKHKM